MKLFKSLLVAPATLGLLAPMSATANEVTISDFTPAEQLAITNSRVDGIEASLNNIEAGSFSETTTASFKAIMAIGAVDGKGVTTSNKDGNEDIEYAYSFQTKLKTSFSGDDSLSIAIDSGNFAKSADTAVGELTGIDQTGDQLKVDGVAYKFPLGDNITVLVGDGLDASKQFTTACVYGGPSDTLDDCGNVNANVDNGGVHLSFEYDFGNGFTTAVGYAGVETGLGTKGEKDAYGANIAYTGDNYGISGTYGVQEDASGNNDVYHAVNAFYSLDNGLNISAGYEQGAIRGVNALADETLAYFVGINGDVGPGELGAAMGTHGSVTESAGTISEQMMYEIYYDYPLNDGITITPLLYTIEGEDADDADETGMMVRTTFKF